MAVTRLERKGRKNKSRAKARVKTIQRLSGSPMIKNVDIEAIKEEFEKNLTKKSAPKKKKEEKPVEAAIVEEKVAAVEAKPAKEKEAVAKTEEKPKAVKKAKAPAKKKVEKKTEE